MWKIFQMQKCLRLTVAMTTEWNTQMNQHKGSIYNEKQGTTYIWKLIEIWSGQRQAM